jgi:ferredoxin
VNTLNILYVMKCFGGTETKISINRENCLGCGACQILCPEVFKLYYDGKSSVVEKYRKEKLGEGIVGKALASCVETAKISCPAEIISVK